jgi:hypothetical protein
MSLTRREVLVLAGSAAAGLCFAGPASAAPPKPPPNGRHVVYRRSCRGRRASLAVKIRNANLRYKTKQAANDPAHPGDTSRIVPLDVSQATFKLWFGHGAHVVDLRTLRAPA